QTAVVDKSFERRVIFVVVGDEPREVGTPEHAARYVLRARKLAAFDEEEFRIGSRKDHCRAQPGYPAANDYAIKAIFHQRVAALCARSCSTTSGTTLNRSPTTPYVA